MKCYNCECTTGLKEWKFPQKKSACKECSECFRKCAICSLDIDLNDYFSIISEDKILRDNFVCYYCVRDGNLHKKYENKK